MQMFLVERNILCVLLTATLVTFFAPALVSALEPCNLEEVFPTTRPVPADGGPTQVHARFFLFDLVDVVTVKQEFTLDFFLHATWEDPRVGEMLRKAGVQQCQVETDKIWFPNMLLLNSRKHRTELPRILHLFDDGTIKGNHRIFGTFAAQMNLVNFPRDTQVLPVTFISTLYSPEELKIIFDASDREEIFTENAWTIELARGSSSVYDLGVLYGTQGDPKESLARFDYEILVKRQTRYYVWKVFLPLCMIVMVSWAVFWIDPSQMGIQTGIGTGMMLSLIAFLFSLQNILPKINYLTRMDVFVYTSLSFVVLAFLETLVSCGLAARGRLFIAQRMDLVSRALFPLAFGGVIGWFWGYW
jgi:hypothetical protein